MRLTFTHQDVRSLWDSFPLRTDILSQDWNYDNFTSSSAEFYLRLFTADATASVDLLQFWVSCLGIEEALEPKEHAQYLAEGNVERISADQYRRWFNDTIGYLLPQYRFEPPTQITHVHRICRGGPCFLDECVIGLTPQGYWGLWILSTA